tara:strand:- start:461 stop:715 length:255 start_codon:yes stop_codon:yes gene_type:complete
MKKIIFILIIFNLLNINVYSEEIIDCSQYNKLSKIYLECKANNLKKKTLSIGKNVIEDTKNYQKKEWSDEKKKLEKAKEKILNN